MKLFILGAGFSKAVYSRMPVLTDLGKHLSKVAAEHPRLQSDVIRRLVSDPELLLSYLYQDLPWKDAAESYWDRGNYQYFAGQIAQYIGRCEQRAFEQDPPDWVWWLIEHLHATRATVATMNYDTVLERLSTNLKDEGQFVSTASLYRLPLTHVAQRTLSLASGPWASSYRLLKLHGSINWFHTAEDASGLFYLPVTTNSPEGDLDRWRDRVSMSDLQPMIIPPVADKTTFYRSHLVKALWTEFRTAVQQADVIFSIGYSLPKTDISMRLMLSAATAEGKKRVYVVNSASGEQARELLDNYRQVFARCEVNDTYLNRPSAVESLAANLQDPECEKEM